MPITTEPSATTDGGTAIAFGPFRLLPAQRMLLEGNAPVRLGSRALDILIALVERPGEVVSKEELALYLYELGDLAADEVVTRSAGDGAAWIAQLANDARAVQLPIPTAYGIAERWVHVELDDEYRAAFAQPFVPDAAARILRRLFRNSGPLARGAILARYAFDEAWLDATLGEWVAQREIVRGHFTAGSPAGEYCDRRNLEQIHQRLLNDIFRRSPGSDDGAGDAQQPTGMSRDRLFKQFDRGCW